MLSHLRTLIGPLRRVLAWPFLKLGMSPTGVGLMGVALAAMAALSARQGMHTLAFWLAAVALATDLIDGEVARASQRCTPEGNYLDAVGDRTRECLLLLGLLPLAPDWVGLALAGSCLTSFVKARCALVRLMDNRDWPGLGDHPDRGALILLAYYLSPEPTIALMLLTLISWSCFLRRLSYARSFISSAKPHELQPYLRESVAYQR